MNGDCGTASNENTTKCAIYGVECKEADRVAIHPNSEHVRSFVRVNYSKWVCRIQMDMIDVPIRKFLRLNAYAKLNSPDI
jgi:hypothetical protein